MSRATEVEHSGPPGVIHRPYRASPLLLLIGLALYAAFPGWFALTIKHDNDFRHIYLGMQALFAGDSPYPPEALFRQADRLGLAEMDLNPYVYLPFTGLALGFMQKLSLAAASTVWFAINHVLMLASLWILGMSISRGRTPLPPATGRMPVLLIFSLLLMAAALNHPFLRTLTAGQLNIVLLFCLVAAFALIQTGRDTAAGAVLGFAAMFKIVPFLFVAYFILTRRLRALASFAATVLVLLLVSVAAVGVQPHLDFLPMLSQMSYGHSTWEEYSPRAVFWKEPANQSLNSFFTHIMVRGNRITAPWFDGTQQQANAATWMVSVLLLAGYLVAGLRVWRSTSFPERGHECPRHNRDGALFHATTGLMLLLPSLMWDHYLILLLPAAAWLMRGFVLRGNYAGLTVIVLSWVVVSIPWNPAECGRSDLGIIVMSLKLWPAVVLYAICLRRTWTFSRSQDSVNPKQHFV